MCAPQPGSTLTLKAVTKARKVSLLGYPGKVAYKQTKEGLRITVPQQLPNNIALAFRILKN